MNYKQGTILILAVTLFSLSELFPPWLYEDGWNSAERSAGFHFILNPPEIKPYAEMKKLFSISDEDSQHVFSVRKDLARQYGQRLFLSFLMYGLLLVLEDRRSRTKVILGVASLCIGIGFLGIYILLVIR